MYIEGVLVGVRFLFNIGECICYMLGVLLGIQGTETLLHIRPMWQQMNFSVDRSVNLLSFTS